MAAPCKKCEKCEKCKDIASGSAPPRTTQLDHEISILDDDRFSDLRFNQETAKKILHLLSLDVGIDKLLEVVQTDDKKKNHPNDLNLKNINKFDSAISESSKVNRKQVTEIHSSRSPIRCPLSDCDQLIGATSVLTHFLLQHRKKFHALNYQEIKKEESSKIEFSEKLIKFEDIVSLGILLFAGAGENNESFPAQTGICRANSFLPDRYQHFVYHLPIIVMACKVCNSALIDEVDLRKNYYDSEDPNRQILILWMITVETSEPIYATITVHDKEGTTSRSSIIKLRSVKDAQNPNDFLCNETNYLMLSRGELNTLSNYGNSNIYLEIFVNELET